jgi:hypothetical protein
MGRCRRLKCDAVDTPRISSGPDGAMAGCAGLGLTPPRPSTRRRYWTGLIRAALNGYTTTFVLTVKRLLLWGDGSMSSVRRITISLIASVGILLACVVAASADITGRPFTTDLTGAAEVTAAGVPNQGDPDGSGTATLSINPGTGEVCWTIEVADVDTVLMAHIHSGASTTTGPILVPLNPYTGDCTVITQELALAIITDPGSYYVNVHTTTYPAGALRGQLTFAR